MIKAKNLQKHRYKIYIICFIATLLIMISVKVVYIGIYPDYDLEDYLDFENDNNTNFTAVANAAALNLSQLKQDFEKDLRIARRIRDMNNNPYIRNEFMSGLTEYPSTFIVIHVTNDKFRFQKLLYSLSTVVAITRALLIFAHDSYVQDIENMIYGIEFARYIQIYYPYSLQLLPNNFPGNDQKFCDDLYSCVDNNNTRNAQLINEKHFWWWQVNFVFERIDALKYNPNFYLFLKCEHYVAEDLIYLFERMLPLLKSDCQECEIINMGAREPHSHQFHVHTANIMIEPFGSTDEINGIAFNRTFWEKIKKHKKDFCYFNDYTWEESLKNVAKKISVKSVASMSPEGSRVLNTACPKETICDNAHRIDQVRGFIKLVSRGLFPVIIDVVDSEHTATEIKSKGHWDDARDKELCMFIAENKYMEFTI